MQSFSLRLKNGNLKTFPKPCIMGIINMSSNSFYQPMKNIDEALKTAEKMIQTGASIIDVGAFATNPMVEIEKESINSQQEMDKLLPVIVAIKKNFNVLISVDTSQPEVMQESVNQGADIINDQQALQIKNAIDVVSELKVPVCLMHSFNFSRQPGSCDKKELLHTIKNDFKNIATNCVEHGITNDRIILDPGFGGGNYGKNAEENFYLLANLKEFTKLGYPLLIGWSRKSMIGEVLNVSARDRLYGSLASASIAAFLGASIIRVHDVAETMDVIKVVDQINQSKVLS